MSNGAVSANTKSRVRVERMKSANCESQDEEEASGSKPRNETR